MSSPDIRLEEPIETSFDNLDDIALPDDKAIDVADVTPIMGDDEDTAQKPVPSAEEISEPEYDEEALEEIEEGLEEVQFYLGQRIVGEAQGILEDLRSNYPNHPQILEAVATMERIEESEKAPRADTAETPAEDAGLSVDSLDFNTDDLDTALPAEDAPGQAGKSEKSRKVALQEQISEGDFATHYDLGIAYKDMGLFDNAIEEFKIASGDPKKIAPSKMMIGMCYVNLNQMDDAIAIYKQGLSIDTLDQQQKLGLLYELGVTYQSMEKKNEALDCFNKIVGYDPKFADVKSRIATLTSGKSEPSKQSLFS
jgi:tetratricopeptide (TPR) repeat protein